MAPGGKGVIAALCGAAITVGLGIGLLIKHCKKEGYDGLNSVVSFSCKLVAASRAVETEEEHPLVADPLAEALAGAAALDKIRRRALAAPAGSERHFKVGSMAIRTRWFDDQIEAALGMPVAVSIPAALRAGDAPPRVDLPAYVWSHPAGHEPRQLVMLGAGMDTRPWRMKLPADLHWFELDRPDVVEAKQRALQEAAAEVPTGGVNGPVEPPSPMESGLARHLSLDSVRFPLRCGSWTAVPCDLGSPAWADALMAAGFDPSRPTVWVAEGLLMYLEESTVRALLSRMAGLSADGSVFVCVSVTQAVIDRMAALKAYVTASDLRGTWTFGCPPDPSQLLSECGWQLRLNTNRAQQAAALGLDPALCGFRPFADRPSSGSNGASRGSAGEGAGGAGAPEAASLFLAATPVQAAAAAQ